MNNLLSRGAIAAIFKGDNVSGPVLQLLACKKMNAAASGKAVDRYRLMLSDGEHTCTAMLATQLNEMVSTGELDVKAAMKLKNYSCNPIANDRRVIVVLDLDIVKKGSEIGTTIGEPTPMRTPGQGAGPGPVQQQQSRPDSTVSHNPPQTARPTSYGTGAPGSSVPNGNRQGSFYGQSNSAMGSTTSPKKVQPISSLTPYQNRWTIKVRVTNKSAIRTWSNARGEGKLFSMDLLDQSGEIRCTAFKDMVDKYYEMIEIGKVYFVSRGTLKPANRQYTSINNDYELTFNNDTMVEPCVEEDVSIPAVQFDFKSISHLENTPEDSMIDVIGVCKSTSDLASVTIKSSNREVNKRSIQLVDDSQKEVSLTLWGKEAEEFDGTANPVIAVKGARLSGFGGRSLSVLQSSIFQVNPDIPRAHHLKGWFDSEGHSQDSQSISSRQGSGGGGGSNTNWLTFHDVHAQNLGQGEKPDYFTVKGTILFVRKENCMYMACPSAECNKKVSAQTANRFAHAAHPSYYRMHLLQTLNKPELGIAMAGFKRFSVVGIVVVLLIQSLFVSSEEVLRRYRRQHDDHDHDHGSEEEYFAVVGNYLLDEEITAQRTLGDFEENHDQNITSTQVGILVSTLFSRVDCENRVSNCSKCSDDFVTDLFTALSVDSTYGLSEDFFHEATPLLLYAVFGLEAVCAAGPGGTDLGEETVFGELMSAGEDGANTTLSEEDLEEILHSMSENYTATTQASCFDVESVFTATVADHEAGANETEVHAIAELVVSNLLNGYCIGEATLPAPEDFVDAIFDAYATSGVIPEEEFEHLLSELGIGGSSDEHDEHDEHEGEADQDDHDDHDHRRRRHVDQRVAAAGYKQREKRAAVEHDHDGHESSDALNVSATCYTGEELLNIYGIDHEAGITEAQYTAMLPSLIHQILSGVCGLDEHEEPSNTYTDAEIWGYSNLAVLIISLLAVLGAVFIPFMSGFVYESVIQTMMALAVATLTGDAILHLIPQAVGLHSHDSSGHDHSVHGPSNPELAYVWKCLLVEIAIYVLFFLERVSSLMSCCKHSHAHFETSIDMDASKNSVKIFRRGSKVSDSKKNLADAENGNEEKKYFWKGCGTIPLMIILGDSLHNFGDGLAIGAAFTLGIPAGLSTSVAVFCHELPHELGDLAVLLNQGMRLSTAVFLNFMSACMCFLGLWIGIPLAQTQDAREWIFAATAGMFLYVGLVNMLPLLHAYKGERKGVIFGLQNLGFLLGILIILIIALYEDAINVAL